MIENYKNLNSKDIFIYLLAINFIGIVFTTFFFGYQYLNSAYFINLFVIYIVSYLYHQKNYYVVRWFWYFYALFTLSGAFLVTPLEAFNQNGLYYVFINIPELILTAVSLHKLLIEN